jgi:hypothetical protein
MHELVKNHARRCGFHGLFVDDSAALEKWLSIRKSYMNMLRKANEGKRPSGSGAGGRVSNWPLYDHCKFLDKHLEGATKRKCNFAALDDDDDVDHDEEEETGDDEGTRAMGFA